MRKEKADTKTAHGISPQSVMYLPNEICILYRHQIFSSNMNPLQSKHLFLSSPGEEIFEGGLPIMLRDTANAKGRKLLQGPPIWGTLRKHPYFPVSANAGRRLYVDQFMFDTFLSAVYDAFMPLPHSHCDRRFKSSVMPSAAAICRMISWQRSFACSSKSAR